jgi:hypothetical protein
MSNYLKIFEFKKQPQEISYLEVDPLNITEDFVFYHSKSRIRGALSRLQYLFKSYTKNPLLALGIRDSFLKDDFTEKFLIVLFTIPKVVEQTNEIIQENSDIQLNEGCYYMRVSSTYLLLLARDMKGLGTGIDIMENLLNNPSI